MRGELRNLLKVRDVQEILGLSRSQVYELVARGEIPHYRIGKAIRFDPQDLKDWLESKKIEKSRRERTW